MWWMPSSFTGRGWQVRPRDATSGSACAGRADRPLRAAGDERPALVAAEGVPRPDQDRPRRVAPQRHVLLAEVQLPRDGLGLERAGEDLAAAPHDVAPAGVGDR